MLSDCWFNGCMDLHWVVCTLTYIQRVKISWFKDRHMLVQIIHGKSQVPILCMDLSLGAVLCWFLNCKCGWTLSCSSYIEHCSTERGCNTVHGSITWQELVPRLWPIQARAFQPCWPPIGFVITNRPHMIYALLLYETSGHDQLWKISSKWGEYLCIQEAPIYVPERV